MALTVIKISLYVYTIVNVMKYISNLLPDFAAYVTEDGKTKVNMFFKGQDHIQITKVRIKVRKQWICVSTALRVTLPLQTYVLKLNVTFLGTAMIL